MKVVPAQPYIWWRLNGGRLLAPAALRGRDREFIATEDGLLVVRCPVEEPVFDPKHDEIREWPL